MPETSENAENVDPVKSKKLVKKKSTSKMKKTSIKNKHAPVVPPKNGGQYNIFDFSKLKFKFSDCAYSVAIFTGHRWSGDFDGALFVQLSGEKDQKSDKMWLTKVCFDRQCMFKSSTGTKF